jgi:hypothetical protein
MSCDECLQAARDYFDNCPDDGNVVGSLEEGEDLTARGYY